MRLGLTIPEALWGRKWPRLALGDLAVTAAVATAAAVLIASAPRSAEGSGSLEVTGASGWARRIALGRDGVTDIPGPLGVTRLEVREEEARILSSPCPLGICRHGGRIGPGGGGPLVCVPNGVVVRLAAAGSGGVDARTR